MVSTMKQVDTITKAAPKRKRRRHSAEFKSRVVAACCEPGASVAGVALANGVNSNLLRRWLAEHGVTPEARRAVARTAALSPIMPEFVPVSVQGPHSPMADIRIELRRGGATVTVAWPVQAAEHCAAWLREWLR